MTENNNDFISKLIEDNEDLFKHLLDNGVNKNKAIDMLKALPEQQQKYDSVVCWNDKEGVQVQYTLLLEDLEKEMNWSSLGEERKRQILWTNGMDVKKYSFGYENRRVIFNNKVVFKDVVYGQERTDKGWIEPRQLGSSATARRYATPAAIDYVWNKKYGG